MYNIIKLKIPGGEHSEKKAQTQKPVNIASPEAAAGNSGIFRYFTYNYFGFGYVVFAAVYP